MHGLFQSRIRELTEEGERQVNESGINPANVRECLRHPMNYSFQVALQTFIHLNCNKCPGHAANNIASSSEPSIVSTTIKCSAIAISFSLFSRRIASAVA